MNADFLNYSTTQVGNISGMHPKTILNYCKKGLIKSSRNGETGDFVINGANLLEFLYRSPQALAYAQSHKHTPDLEHIFGIIKNRPKVHSMDDLCAIFKNSKSTISLWVRRGYITPFSYERGEKTRPVFRDDDIYRMVKKIPRLRKKYIAYYRKNHEHYMLALRSLQLLSGSSYSF